MRICEHACDRCRGGDSREDFYTFCIFVTREICLCYFSAFFVGLGDLKLGWEGEGDRGREIQSLAPFGSLANHVFSHIARVEPTGGTHALFPHPTTPPLG